jgi:hypothetical protein
VVLLILVAALLLSHPFTGIRHDGILYAGDALARIAPGELRDDLYFLYGSQGRFTLLPAFYGFLIRLFGLGGGTIAGMLLALTLYLAATIYVVTWIAPPSMRAVCVLAVVLGWTIYGGQRVFGYSEPFLTARSFAEPAVLLALGLMLRRRFLVALVALGAAVVIHPLIAACGVVVFWIMLVQADRRWFWLGPIGVVALCVLGATGLGPFSDVFARYDDQWLALVHEANSHAFVLRWSMDDFGIIFFNATCLWFAHRFTDRREYRLLIVAVAITGLGSTLVSLGLVDGLSNPFFGKLQIWRALWLMQWVALAGLPIVVLHLWSRDDHGRVSATLLTIGWMAPFSVVVAPVAVLAVAIELARHRMTISRALVRIVIALAVLAALVIVVQYEFKAIKLGLLLGESTFAIVAHATTMNTLLMVGALAFIVLMRKCTGRVALVLALSIVLVSMYLWDQRAPWTRNLESRPLGAYIWPGLIEPQARVYWHHDMIAPWVLLGHANYYAQQQGSGAVFSRDMIVELEKRKKIATAIEMQEQICRVMNLLNTSATSCEPDADAVRSICTEGKVDYVVIQSTVEGKTPLADFSTGVVENGYEKKFYLYRCSALN